MNNTTDSKTVFQWTDDLVAEFCNYFRNIPITEVCKENQFEKFKQSKLKEAEETKRIEVRSFKRFGGGNYGVTISHNIPEEKYDAVKRAIEQVLNNEVPDIPTLDRQNFGERIITSPDGSFPDIHQRWCVGTQDIFNDKPKDTIQDIPKRSKDMATDEQPFENRIGTDTIQDKGWEVVSFESIHSETLTLKNFKYRSETSSISDIDFLLKHYSIKSVRRLSDNTVFSVGDMVGYDNGNTRTKQDWAIDNFFVKEDGRGILARSKGNINCEYVDKWLYKNTPPKEEVKPLLFTTEDGVGIFDVNTTVYKISKTDFTKELSNASHVKNNFTYIKNCYFVFSTKEAAEQYILDNKPCLSVQDILNIGNSIGNFIGVRLLELKKIANQKINPTKEQASPKQMWNKHSGIHDENDVCRGFGCEEYNPLDKNHQIKKKI